MNYRKLTNPDCEVSEVSLGTFPFKGWWGEPLSDNSIIEIIESAIDLGINSIENINAL